MVGSKLFYLLHLDYLEISKYLFWTLLLSLFESLILYLKVKKTTSEVLRPPVMRSEWGREKWNTRGTTMASSPAASLALSTRPAAPLAAASVPRWWAPRGRQRALPLEAEAVSSLL